MSSRVHPVPTAELQAELDDFPDYRAKILLEAAQDWHSADDSGPAIELLTVAVEFGGEDGGIARVVLAEVLFDCDRAADAWAQLDMLRRDRIASPVPYQMAAELWEERGDLDRALMWFNIAASRLTDEELADWDTEAGALTFANGVFAGRRRVRRALGVPNDEFDDAVESARQRVDELFSAAAMHNRRLGLRVLFWPRAELSRARDTWPQLGVAADADVACKDRETANRELAESGASDISMVPLTVAKLIEYCARTGADPMKSETRLACIDEIFGEGKAIAWPPPRNAPCWCGSAIKYKKCCGRPTDH